MDFEQDVNDPFAAKLRGFGPAGLFAMLLVLAGNFLGPFKALPVLVWAQWSRTPWRELGFVRPASRTRTVMAGIVFGVAFKFAMKAVVMPLLGAPSINATYSFVTGDPAALAGVLFLVIAGGGFGEELMFRGYLFERLTKVFGSGAGAKLAIVVITSALFASLHYPDQHLAGAEQAMITGLTFGTIYAITGRIWMIMIAHAAFDVAALAMIYWNLETNISHLLFR
jgi:membrane protease YdiL (CAAX protease family)